MVLRAIAVCVVVLGWTFGNTSSAQSSLRPFSLTTPSPLTNYSTISKHHIEHLHTVFASLGYELTVTHDSGARALDSFKGGRYHGGIFIEGVHPLAPNLKVTPAIEHVHYGFFSQEANNHLTNPNDWPAQIPVALSNNGLQVLNTHWPELQENIKPIIVNHPVQILRLVQSGRAQLGFTAKVVFTSSYMDGRFAQENFQFLPGLDAERELYLYVQEEFAFLKADLKKQLIDLYLPALPEISNNHKLRRLP